MDTVGEVPVRRVEITGTGQRPAPRSKLFRPSASPPARTDGRRIYAGVGEQFEYDVYSVDGMLTMRVRRAHEPRPVTDADIDAFVESILAEYTGPEPGPEEHLRSLPVADVFPAYRWLMPDAEGNVWAAHRDATTIGASAEWSVFASDGRWLGTITMPAGLYVREIGADYVLGTTRDEYDVPRVELHRLIK